MTQQPNPPSTAPLNPIDADFTDDDLVVGELTAAIFDAQRTEEDALPPALADRLAVTGEALVRARRVPPLPTSVPTPTVATRSPFRSAAAWTGWLAAAALSVMVLRGSPAGSPTPAAAVTPVPALAPALDQDVRLLRAALLEDPTLVQVAWSPTQDTLSRFVEGEVLWSPSLQKGVMRIIGLAPNDRKRWSYQLWIFDEMRNQKYPVDGGVFDIAPGQVDLLVPIRARLPVGKAVLFAVTVEQPGGVVVSSRERITMTATPVSRM